MALVESLGADKVIDYTNEDFTQNGEKYDLIFDILGKCSFSHCQNSLTEPGMLLYASFKAKQLWQMARTSLFGKKRVVCGLAIEKPEDLVFIKELIEAGEFKSVIDKRYPLAETAVAHRYYESGKRTGNVVLTVA